MVVYMPQNPILIEQLAQKRILILDGAMGAMIQRELLAESDFRGERFKDHPVPLKDCNDLLCLTKPFIVSGIHEAYLKAGADIIETCSFNATSLSLADYGLADYAYEISVAAAALARKAADVFSVPEKPRFVAGSIGPTAKSASIAPDLDNPAKRSVTWDALESAYYDNARGLLDGGADIFLIETVFDTLNAKAAIFAVRRLAAERGLDLPLIISATVSDNGRILSGQSVDAFCASVLHAKPLALGLNCSFGAQKLKPYISELASAAPCFIAAYPNAGLPNSQGLYDESPETMADHLEEYMREGLVNIAGGCCGSSPEHIAAIAARAERYSPRIVPAPSQEIKITGLDVLEVSADLLSTFISQMLKTAEDPAESQRGEFNKLLKEGDYDGAVDIVRDTVDNGAELIEVYIDDTVPNASTVVSSFFNLALQYRDIASRPVLLDSPQWEVIEAGLKCLQGKGIVRAASLGEPSGKSAAEEAERSRRLALVQAYGAAVV